MRRRKQRYKSKNNLFIIISIFLISNFLVGYVSGTEVLTSSSNYGEWCIWRWYEFYNINQDGKAEGWIVLRFDFLKENATNDFQLEIELPAYNESIEYYSPNSSVVSFSRWDSPEGVDVNILFNKSASKNYSSFEIAVRYALRENLVLTKKSECFESFLRYEFETRISIWDELLPDDINEDSPIINIYISIPGDSSITTPENFLKISKTQFKKIGSIKGRNWANEPICEQLLPDIKPSENDYLTIRYIGGASPGIIIFEYSFTNTWIVALTFLAVILGLVGSTWAILLLGKSIYYWIKNKRKQNKIDKGMKKSGEEREMKIGIKFLIGAVSLWAGVLIGIILKSSFSSIEIPTYMIVGSNIVMIFLMLGTILYMNKSTREHINAVEQSSREQINTMKRWSNIKRKQLLKSLLEELNHNIILYEELVDIHNKKEYGQRFNNFIFVSMEKCLSDSPIDDEKINHNILVLYYLIKVHDNKITATRTPNISKNSLEGLIKSIADNYEENKWLFKSTKKSIEKYEQNITIED